MANPFTLTVCASGGGGNFQALIDARDELGFTIALLLTDRPCGALARAEAHGIPTAVRTGLKEEKALIAAFEEAIPSTTDLIVLAGFMPIIPKVICERWRGKIINTHPSLLPKYGGRGMYGVKVQEAVIGAGEKIAGCTVHYVNEVIDGGAILLQKEIAVESGETPWQLGGRIFLEENKLLVEAVRLIQAASQRAG